MGQGGTISGRSPRQLGYRPRRGGFAACVSDAYLALLRQRGVSSLLAGAHDVDLSLAPEKIGTRFGVCTLTLEGRGRPNGGMLRAGLIDEVSAGVVAPLHRDGHVPPSVSRVHRGSRTPFSERIRRSRARACWS
jgi:riboflavin biosynthesis pyrimidine reductase